jgi:hypothetical protein
MVPQPVADITGAAEASMGVVVHENTAHVLDVTRRTRMSSIHVIWDTGGSRIALNSAGTTLFTATFHKGGVAAYALPGGEVLWHRDDLKGTQRLSYDPAMNQVLVVRDRRPTLILDATSGATVTQLMRTRGTWPSPDGRYLLCDREKRLTLADRADGRTIRPLPRESFGLLAACFCGDIVAVSEVGGPVRAFESQTGVERWHIAHTDWHYLGVQARESGTVLGMRWKYHGRPNPSALDVIDSHSGKVLRSSEISALGAHGTFLNHGRQILTTRLSIVETDTGEVSPDYAIRWDDQANA